MTRCPAIGPGNLRCERAWWHDDAHVALDADGGPIVWDRSDRVELPDADQDGLSGCAGIALAVVLVVAIGAAWVAARLLARLL